MLDLFGFVWVAFPHSREAVEAQERLSLPHWSDLPTPGMNPCGVILLEQRVEWPWRVSRSGFLILTEQPTAPPVPDGWQCKPMNLADGWVGQDSRGRVEVVTGATTDGLSPIQWVRHFLWVGLPQG